MISHTKRILATLTLSLFLSTPSLAHAATYYVSPNGSDSSNGSTSSPFKTISKGVVVLQAGDTLEVAPGTYANFNVSKSGTSSAPITIKAKSAVISNVQTAINLSGSYLNVSGFEVAGTSSHAVLISGKNISFSDFIVRNSVLENMGSNGSCSGSGGWGSGLKVMVGGENINLKNGKIYNNCGEGLGVTRGKNVSIKNLIAYDNFSVNFYLDNSSNVTLENSLSYCTSDTRYYRNGNPAAGILIGEESYSGWGAQLSNLTIKNNIVSGCTHLSFYRAEVSPGGLKGATIANNTLHNLKNNNGRGIHIATEPDNRDIKVSNNITGGTITQAGYITSSGNVATATFTGGTPNPQDPMSFTPTTPGVGANPSLITTTTSPSTPSTPLPTPILKQGDANEDNQVNDADYSIWRSNYRLVKTGPKFGDFNTDNKIDGIDYMIWLNNYGL